VTTLRSSLSALLLVASVLVAPSSAATEASAQKLLVPGATLSYRYAIYDRNLIGDGAEAHFGFMSCELIAVHGVEGGAFRVACDGGPEKSTIAWTPWSDRGYYAWRDDGLHHVTNPSTSELRLPREADPTQWGSRSILVLGDPVDARCPAETEPSVGQSVFEEVCWTPQHGPVFFVGVDTTDGIAESSWELLHVEPPGTRATTAVTADRAKKLLKGWLWSQNASRLQNYSWLYGTVFHGVERGAVGTGSFDRAEWLRKYATVLARKTRVRIEGVKIFPAGDTTIVLFEQHRKMGARKDHGLRELRLELERGRVVISREEMLYALAD